MTQKLLKLTLSVAASAVIVTSSFALDPAITNFGYVYDNGSEGGALTMFDASNPNKKKIIPSIPSEGSVGISPTGAWLYGIRSWTATATMFNAYTGAIVNTINTGGSNPNGIIISSDGSKAYMTNADNQTVSVINTVTNSVTGTINVGTNPYGIAISQDGTKVYVANTGIVTLSPSLTQLRTALLEP